jgi:predicted DCC family thiol-disulfide oxidoreductase YuxK
MTNLNHESKAMLPRVGWVLYDGGCGFCFRWVHFWEKMIERRGFSLQDLQSAWEAGSLNIPKQNLLDDILIMTRDGNLQSGADAYLFVARRIWWAWPFYAIFHLPGFNWVLWQGYHWFNRNRYLISRHCPLPQQAKSAHDLQVSTKLSRDI